MRLVAALAWFDEPPDSLARLAHSLHGVADALVAVDGRWDLMPSEHDSSSGAERFALETARYHGVDVKIFTGGPEQWKSQVAKRDWMMACAAEYGDWVLVVDGDTFVERFDALAVREALAGTALGVAEVTVRNLNRPWPWQHLAPQVLHSRLIYRAGTRVYGPAHNDYVRHGVRVNGDPAIGDLAPALDLTEHVEVAHDNRNRGPARNQAAVDYRRARRLAGIEVPA